MIHMLEFPSDDLTYLLPITMTKKKSEEKGV